jgi:RNA polymerase sigma-70 factor (ECF subfamily)
LVPEHLLEPATLGDHVDRLYRAALGLTGRPTDAEDLVQETFARVLSRPRVVRADDDIGYLLRVLRNTYVSQLRTAGRRPVAADTPADELELPDQSGLGQPERALELGELHSVIAGLADDFRDVLVAVDIVGLSYAETAKSLKVAEGTVMSRLYRARRKVAQELGGRPD